MNLLCIVCALLLCVVGINGQQRSGSSVGQPKAGDAVNEVVVESSLYIKKKPQIRRVRDVNNLTPYGIISNLRVKRQQKRGRNPARVQSSQSAAQAAANNNYFGKDGFGGSAANAQAQGFQTQGPLGGFGATAANTQTQSFNAGPNGIQGAAGASTSQTYKLPNGKTVNVAFSNGFSAGPNGIAGSNSNGVTIN